MSVSPTTPEGIAITLEHIQGQLEILLARSEKAATRDELRELTLEVKAQAQRLRALEDDRTERKTIIWLIGGFVTMVGVPGLVLIARTLLAGPA